MELTAVSPNLGMEKFFSTPVSSLFSLFGIVWHESWHKSISCCSTTCVPELSKLDILLIFLMCF